MNYSKILLFSLPLNILANNKNKLYITSHIPTNTSRVLSECDIQTSIYDKDEDMKSVKENFDRKISQRFEKYEERMITQRQKYKEKCDKDIKKIILNDKIDKSLVEKVEKGCLRCGFGLGGVAAGVGIFGSLGTYGWKVAATAMAYETAEKGGIEAGIAEGIKVSIQGLSNKLYIQTLGGEALGEVIKAYNFKDPGILSGIVMEDYINLKESQIARSDGIFRFIKENCLNNEEQIMRAVLEGTKNIAEEASEAAAKMTVETTNTLTLQKTTEITTVSTTSYTAIIASTVAIVVIVLIMIIIYLILRYRRKKRMNKKQQYTKLLNQ
ncbi:PIR protein, putative [Plasmodium sp.]|nr:PIR protein, putative [Plasmodium sp.]